MKVVEARHGNGSDGCAVYERSGPLAEAGILRGVCSLIRIFPELVAAAACVTKIRIDRHGATQNSHLRCPFCVDNSKRRA
jgi:hypothetical protein